VVRVDGPADRTSMPKHYIKRSRKEVKYFFIALCASCLYTTIMCGYILYVCIGG